MVGKWRLRLRDRTVRLWRVGAGAGGEVLESHSSWVRNVMFSPDGRLVVSAADDMTVRVWDVRAGRTERVLGPFSGWARALSFSKDGRLVVCTADDMTVKLWETDGKLA